MLMLCLQLMSLMPRIHLLFPLTLVRSFWSDMMDSAQSFITSSWTFYLQADDGKIVIFQVLPFFIEIKVSWLLTSTLLLPAKDCRTPSKVFCFS